MKGQGQSQRLLSLLGVFSNCVLFLVTSDILAAEIDEGTSGAFRIFFRVNRKLNNAAVGLDTPTLQGWVVFNAIQPSNPVEWLHHIYTNYLVPAHSTVNST